MGSVEHIHIWVTVSIENGSCMDQGQKQAAQVHVSHPGEDGSVGGGA